MTDSYFSSIGRASDAPPDISKTNYLDTEPDMAKAVNENIDQISKSWDDHYNQMIEIYKHIHKQKSPAENLLEVMKHGKQFKDDFEEWQDEWEPIRDMNGKINERVAELKKIHGEDSAAYLKSLQTIVDDDPEIKKEVENETELATSREITNKYNYKQLKDGNVEDGVKGLEGPNGLFMQGVEIADDIKKLKEGIPGWLKVSDEGIKHHLESFGYTADGQPIYKSLNEATLPEEKFVIRLRNIAWYAYLHKDVARGRFGKYKKEFTAAILLEQDTWKKTVLEDHAAASLEIITDRNDTEFWSTIDDKPETFLTQVTTHAGHPEFLNAKGNVNHGLVLDRYKEKLIDGIADGKSKNPAKLVESIGNLEFRAFGHPEGTTVKFKDHWKKRYAELVAAKNEYYKAERLAIEAEREATQDAEQVALVKWSTGKPYNEIQAKIGAYMRKYSLSQEQLPTSFKDLQYRGKEPDEAIIERNERIKLTRPLTELDIKDMVPGTPAYEGYVEEIENPRSVGSVEGYQPGSTRYRDEAVLANVAKSLNMQVEEAKGNPKATLRKEKAIAIYNGAYYNAKKEPNVTNAMAHAEAMEQVKGLLFDPDATEATFARTSTIDVDAIKTVNKAVALISKNPDLLNQSKPLEGEEPHIELGAKYLDNYINDRGGVPPTYYSSVAAKLGTTVPKIIRTRLEALGRIKEGEVVFPEEGKPGERLLVNPTAAKTMRVYNLNEDYEWMLDASKSPAAIANGGYLSVSDSDGNYTSIEEVTEKPMEAITMGDVVNLIANGYTGFGVYEIPSYNLMDILNTNGIPMDMVFDEDGQDFLYLAALRHKAQKAQRNTGIVTDYRRLVNIDKDLHDKFNELAGDLVKGKPWLDLNNLAPEVAKEFIRELTQ